MNYRSRIIFVLTCFAVLPPVYSSGFRIPETSVAGIGLSNALVANHKELGSLPYNPASMSFLNGRNLVFGAALVSVDIDANPDTGTATSSQNDSSVLIPNYYYMSTVDKMWSYGLNINAPFGLETKWPDETYSSFTGALDGLEPEASHLEMLNINPNISYRMGNTSLAFGLNYYDVRELIFNTQAISISGSGGEVGWNAALLHVEGDWSFGLSYRSPIEVNLDGSASVAASSSSASATIEFPSMLQAGARLAVNRDWSVEIDIDRTGWNSFDDITISHSLPGATGVTSPITSTNNWKDANAYRVGAEYRTDPKGKLRFGFTIDETGQGDDYFTARIPDADRQLFSVGYLRNMKDWGFELGYMYVKFDDRRFNSSIDYLTQAGGGNTESNGTNAYNGEYNSDAHVLGIGFHMKL